MRIFGIEIYWNPRPSAFDNVVYPPSGGKLPKGLKYMAPTELRDALGEIIINLQQGNKAFIDPTGQWKAIHYEAPPIKERVIQNERFIRNKFPEQQGRRKRTGGKNTT